MAIIFIPTVNTPLDVWQSNLFIYNIIPRIFNTCFVKHCFTPTNISNMFASHMKTVFLPTKIQGLIFDVDLTLYENRDYYQSLNDRLIERLAGHRQQDPRETAQELQTFRDAFTRTHGRSISMADTFTHFGIGIQQSAAWRAELFEPEAFLKNDPRLVQTMQRLHRHFTLGVVTNNAGSVARRTLAVLGVAAFFTTIVGLDRSGVSKPDMKPFRLAVSDMDCRPECTVCIGDRQDIDVDIPVKNGMGGILVESLNDVYGLPDLLTGNVPSGEPN